MSNITAKNFATIVLGAAILVLPAAAVLAQSSGGGSAGGGTGGAAASRGSAGSVGRATSPSTSIGRAGVGGTGMRATTPTNNPRSLSNQPATTIPPSPTAPGTYVPGGTPPPSGTTTPSGTAYPSGPALEAARQRALQSPPGTQIPPSAAGVGADRSRTLGVGDSGALDATPGLPNQADPNRRASPGEMTGSGRPRRGAVARTMAECEAAWDSTTHMSRQTWRDTCRRTLTAPHM